MINVLVINWKELKMIRQCTFGTTHLIVWFIPTFFSLFLLKKEVTEWFFLKMGNKFDSCAYIGWNSHLELLDAPVDDWYDLKVHYSLFNQLLGICFICLISWIWKLFMLSEYNSNPVIQTYLRELEAMNRSLELMVEILSLYSKQQNKYSC